MTADVPDNPKLRPSWLRPGAIVVAIGLHLTGLLGLTVPRPALPSTDDTMEITIAQGTPEVEQPPPAPPPAPEQPPQPPPPDPPPVQPPPQEQPPDPLPPDPTPPAETKAAKREVADALAIPLPRKPKPKPKPRPKVVKPAPETPPTKETPPPPPPSEAKQTGEQDAHDQAVHARATYAGKVLAAIRSRRPADSSNSGSVVVSFAINAAGEMTNVTIVHSSGRHELDAAALRMVRAATPGPPPDGSFAGSTTINFVEN